MVHSSASGETNHSGCKRKHSDISHQPGSRGRHIFIQMCCRFRNSSLELQMDEGNHRSGNNASLYRDSCYDSCWFFDVYFDRQANEQCGIGCGCSECGWSVIIIPCQYKFLCLPLTCMDHTHYCHDEEVAIPIWKSFPADDGISPRLNFQSNQANQV